MKGVDTADLVVAESREEGRETLVHASLKQSVVPLQMLDLCPQQVLDDLELRFRVHAGDHNGVWSAEFSPLSAKRYGDFAGLRSGVLKDRFAHVQARHEQHQRPEGEGGFENIRIM